MQGNLSRWFSSVFSSHVIRMCVYFVCMGGKGPWSLPIFFSLRKCAAGQMENWEKLNRPRANRYMAPSFCSYPPQPTLTTQKPTLQNCSRYVLFFSFHGWNFQHGSASAIERNKLYHTEWSPQDRVSLEWADHHTAKFMWRKHTAKFLQIRQNGLLKIVLMNCWEEHSWT